MVRRELLCGKASSFSFFTLTAHYQELLWNQTDTVSNLPRSVPYSTNYLIDVDDRMVRDEFLLAATAQNLRKLAKLIPMPSPHPA